MAVSFASKNGHLQVVKFLVENGADIHANDESALRHASKHGCLEVVKFLVENGIFIKNIVFYRTTFDFCLSYKTIFWSLFR